jgi:deoxyribodipyrimidine photo-lyase
VRTAIVLFTRDLRMHDNPALTAAAHEAERIDWRTGARYFFQWLVDGDVANNVGNRQWVAGTGANPRPARAFNPLSQARRFDPDGAYVRRYVPELAAIEGRAVHEPWKLREHAAGYPAPIVDRT